MSHFFLLVADGAFFALHTAIVLFNVLGWAFRATRRANLALLLLTAFSWLGMGLFYGAGYCVCTDLHFRVRHALGLHDPGNTYIGFLGWKLTGVLPDPGLVKLVCGIAFVFCFGMSLTLNLRDTRERHRVGNPSS